MSSIFLTAVKFFQPCVSLTKITSTKKLLNKKYKVISLIFFFFPFLSFQVSKHKAIATLIAFVWHNAQQVKSLQN